MTETGSATERFLQQLAGGLEVLGPHETNEVLAEVSSHIEDARAEADGDERAALAGFGSADTLAARILEERGVLTEGSSIPQAPAWARIIAFVTDVALWLAVCVVALLVVDLIAPNRSLAGFFGPFGHFKFYSLWTVLIAAAAAAAWWSVRRTRARAHSTAGMKGMGLRRVRAGSTTRIVRSSDIPGLSRGRLARLRPLARTLVALSFSALFCWWFFSAAVRVDDVDWYLKVQGALRSSSDAVMTVSGLYGRTITGAQDSDPEIIFEPVAADVPAALLARYNQGAMASYEIFNVELASGYDSLAFAAQANTEVVMNIDVIERSRVSTTPAAYRYCVVQTWTFQGAGGTADPFKIRSMDEVEVPQMYLGLPAGPEPQWQRLPLQE
jgi:hypothetical protein